MIFYFSGTGNSLHAAKVIADAQDEQIVSIAEEMNRHEGILKYKFGENEVLGFVYPVYAWGPPKIVLDFIKRQNFVGCRPYVFSLCTCASEEGCTTLILHKALASKGIKLNSAFALQMPNNYILGFNIDSKDVIKEKLIKAESDLKVINSVISDRESDVFRLIPGSFPRFKSRIINPLFNNYAIDTSKFYTTDACNSCGLCQKVCPLQTITVTNRPNWGKACAQCLSCINRCPEKAIQYGKGTENKGRYVYIEQDHDSMFSR